ncbi:MAG: hypothetical protein WCK67_12435 [bacterium]
MFVSKPVYHDLTSFTKRGGSGSGRSSGGGRSCSSSHSSHSSSRSSRSSSPSRSSSSRTGKSSNSKSKSSSPKITWSVGKLSKQNKSNNSAGWNNSSYNSSRAYNDDYYYNNHPMFFNNYGHYGNSPYGYNPYSRPLINNYPACPLDYEHKLNQIFLAKHPEKEEQINKDTSRATLFATLLTTLASSFALKGITITKEGATHNINLEPGRLLISLAIGLATCLLSYFGKNNKITLERLKYESETGDIIKINDTKNNLLAGSPLLNINVNNPPKNKDEKKISNADIIAGKQYKSNN